MPTSTTSTTRTKHASTSPLVLFLPLVFLFGLGAGYLFWGLDTAPAAADASGVRRVNVTTGDAPSLGPADAPVTIIEFSDYQCPYCKLWHDSVYDRLLANYPGKVRFVYRDFPLDGHPEALPAAEAAQCAGEQNAYWKYHDVLFGEQYGLSNAAYLRYAQDLGLNMPAFTACLDGHRFQAAVKDSLRYAVGLGVGSTPTFYINGIEVIGAQPYETFQQLIDQELAGKDQ
jgi:protein-disulfide isomerase